MIVWSGRGFLSIIVLFASVIVVGVILPKGQSDASIGVGFLVAAAFSWFMGRKWNGEKGRVMMDRDTGQEVEFKPNHSIFWIKMQYWGIIFGIIGILFLSQAFI